MRAALLLLFLLLSGCQTDGATPLAQQSVAAGPLADPIKKEEALKLMLNERSRLWKDPYSIREAKVGNTMICPTRNNLFPPGASCLCVELNAKNAMGGYTGLRRTIMVYPVGAPMQTSDGGEIGFADICQGLTPYPALNGRS